MCACRSEYAARAASPSAPRAALVLAVLGWYKQSVPQSPSSLPFTRLLVVSLATLALAACSRAPAGPCDVPAEAIEGFEITISTGSDATDADIYFCIARHSDASRDCTRLDTLGVDDWDSGSIETYMVTSAVAPGDLAGVSIENRGDAPDISFDGNDWTLDGVRLVARTASTGLLVFNEQDMDFYMDAGDIWAPSCTF